MGSRSELIPDVASLKLREARLALLEALAAMESMPGMYAGRALAEARQALERIDQAVTLLEAGESELLQ